MLDRQALFEKFLDLIQTPPPAPDYLEGEPDAIASFDPYQMVAEWIALRHEVKQQGKLLQTSQTTLQQALAALQFEKEQLQHPLAASQKQGVAQADQKTLYRDLLTVLDALDQACTHWQAQIDDLATATSPPIAQPGNQPFWQRWLQQVAQPLPNESPPAASTALRDVLISNQQGVDLIRRSLLGILRQRQVVPISAQGQSFNPQTMYAVGRQESTSVPENTVIQEVVRGYTWGEQVLREAQVIVAAKQA
ncbi:MAG: nucleotide exchange factor GrpE [Leptolyngbyaceae cyanobacterium RU_5_1]|nr:nucleotide exchange factor GrpE [Leptolyngbyaceae cyanobacterium RU_5_1]